MPSSRERLPRWLLADVERGFLGAYYRYVRHANIAFGSPDGDLIVQANGPDGYLSADFSTHYKFPEHMKPATLQHRLTGRCDELVRWASVVAKGAPVIYEI